jgi:hypothetical protein
MTLRKRLLALLFRALLVILCSAFVFAQTSSEVAKPGPPTASVDHDGRHDFDSLVGTWKAHTKRRVHPFAGSDTWIELDGTEIVQKIWDGAMLEKTEFEGDSTKGPVGLMLYTYNPQSHQWYVYFASRKDGKIGLPNVGEFSNGRGEFFAQDTLNGKWMLDRYVWSKIASNSPHFEESRSSDGGQTWELDLVVDFAPVSDDTGNAHPTRK